MTWGGLTAAGRGGTDVDIMTMEVSGLDLFSYFFYQLMYASSIKMYKSNRMGSYYKVRLWESLTCRQFGRQFIGDEVRQDVRCRDALHLKKYMA